MSVSESGGAVEGVDNIMVSNSIFRQHKKPNIVVSGQSSGKLPVNRLVVTDSIFYQGNQSETAAADTFSIDAKHFVFSGNSVKEPETPGTSASGLCTSNTTGATAVISNNDFSESGRTEIDAFIVSIPSASKLITKDNLFQSVNKTPVIYFSNSSGSYRTFNHDLSKAVDVIGTVQQTTLVIDAKPNDLTENLTIPGNINLDWKAGCTLGGAYTLTINGSVKAGDYDIFESELTVAGSPKIGLIPTDLQISTIADPSGGTTVDTQSRTAIASIIDALQTAGIIQ